LEAVERIKEQIGKIIEEDNSLFLVDLVLKGHQGNQRLTVELDGDEGLPIETCASVSRQLSNWLEEENIISGKFILEVSSPGADKPLKNIRQYKKHLGRELKITTTEGYELQGELAGVVGETLKIKEKKNLEPQEVPFEKIKSSNVIISFK